MPPGGNGFTRLLGRALLRGFGWRLHGKLPNREKFIIAVAPHSSNFDFILTVGVIMSLGFRCRFLAKASLFRFPLNLLMHAFGGIHVVRDSAQGVVEQMTTLFLGADQLILGIAPEGTRGKVDRWRSGFALIAQAADIPVQPAIIDYRRKIVTFTDLIDEVSDPQQVLQAVQRDAATGHGRGS